MHYAGGSRGEGAHSIYLLREDRDEHPIALLRRDPLREHACECPANATEDGQP